LTGNKKHRWTHTIHNGNGYNHLNGKNGRLFNGGGRLIL